MSSGSTLEAPPPRGLRGLLGRIRRSVFRGRRRPAKPTIRAQRRTLPPPIVVDIDPDDLAIEPLGSTVRERPGPPAPAVLFNHIREGLNLVPPLPHVVRELIAELNDPASSAKTVARIATSDPALAAALIRTVNSASLGLRRKVTSVSESVSYLGYSVVRSVVIRMRLEQVLPSRAGASSGYDSEDLWVHALAVAHAGACLAERVKGLDRGFVSTLGLLHDIGKLAINSQFPDSAAKLLAPDPAHLGESLLDRERRVLGADHAELGAMLAAHWKLPNDLVEAIRWHHAPLAAPGTLPPAVRAATILVHLANQLAKYCYVYGQDMEIDLVDDATLRRVGFVGPVTRLLNAKTRAAISRGIFFADECSTRPVGTVRRFIRLLDGPDARRAMAKPRQRSQSEPRVRITDDNADRLFSAGRPAGRGSTRKPTRPPARQPDASPASTGADQKCFRGRTTPKSIETLSSEVTAHLDALPLEEDVRLPARFLARRLLPALLPIGKSGEPADVAVSLDGVRLLLAIRSPVLAFAARLGRADDGADLHPRVARKVLETELANVLNLRWFAEIYTSRDGTTLMFVSHPNCPRDE